jgi:hypothetical protein
MDVKTVACDVCGLQKQETNHWLVAITHPALEGVIFQQADLVQTPRSQEARYEDICGQACAHKRFSAWLDDLNNERTAAAAAETEAVA